MKATTFNSEQIAEYLSANVNPLLAKLDEWFDSLSKEISSYTFQQITDIFSRIDPEVQIISEDSESGNELARAISYDVKAFANSLLTKLSVYWELTRSSLETEIWYLKSDLSLEKIERNLW